MTTTAAPPDETTAPDALTPAVEENVLLPVGSRILHIGPPKTGTTALQAAFHLGRDRTERQGVHYASHGRHAMTAVLAGIQQPSPWTHDRKPPSTLELEPALADIRGSTARRVVLSSEFFADATPEAIRRVVSEIGPEQIQIVVTLRPLAKIMASQWQQYVQNQLTIGFDDWLDGVMNRPRGKVTPTFWKRHRHDELVARWAEVVGPDRLTVVALDDADRDMVLRVFERLTGLAPGTLITEPDLSNRSMTVPEIEILRAFNATFKKERLPAPLYSRIMRFGAAATCGPGRRARRGADRAPRVGGRAHRESRPRDDGLHPRIGRPDRRRPRPDDHRLDDARPRVRPVVVTPTVAASAAMGILVASGLARGTGPIEANESEGLEGNEFLARAPRPVQEPPELLRISTSQLGVVIVRRAKARVLDQFNRLKFWQRSKRK